VKFLGAFLPAIVLLSAEGLRQAAKAFEKVRARETLFFLLSFILVGEFALYANGFATRRVFFAQAYSPVIYAYFHRVRAPHPVTTVIKALHHDILGLAQGTTSLSCNEPLFGYGLEAFHSKVIPGPVEMLRDGAFNLNHPGCLLYPSYFHCQPWDRIPAADGENFRRFVQGEPSWGVPPWQTFLLGVSVVTIALLLLVAGMPADLPFDRAQELLRAVMTIRPGTANAAARVQIAQSTS
jgi:hypothetical protein